MPWTDKELDQINGVDELNILTLKSDGTLRNPVTIWAVRVGDSLYIRAIKGPEGKWYRHALERHHGRIEAGGVTKDVEFQEAGPEAEAEIDAAYKTKYHQYGDNIVDSTQTDKARSATLRLIP